MSFYRIYRDGSRYDRTSNAATTYTDASAGTGAHFYWVTAVDSDVQRVRRARAGDLVGLRLADERGMTLVELLIGITLSLGVLAATLTTFNGIERDQRDNDGAQRHDRARAHALDIQARQLRNLAKRVASPVIDTLASYDLIFQTSDPARTWVRYCLDTTTAPATTERARLWTGELAVAERRRPRRRVTAAMRSSCPEPAGPRHRSSRTTSRTAAAGTDRPMFTYTCTTGTACTASTATYDQVVEHQRPAAHRHDPRLRARRAARRQRRPSAQPEPGAGRELRLAPASTSRTVVLNAAASTDYEGRTLDYYWFKTTMPAVASIDCAQPTVTGTGSPRTLWGAPASSASGITLTYTFAAGDGASGTHPQHRARRLRPRRPLRHAGDPSEGVDPGDDPDMTRRLRTEDGSVLVDRDRAARDHDHDRAGVVRDQRHAGSASAASSASARPR